MPRERETSAPRVRTPIERAADERTLAPTADRRRLAGRRPPRPRFGATQSSERASGCARAASPASAPHPRSHRATRSRLAAKGGNGRACVRSSAGGLGTSTSPMRSAGDKESATGDRRDAARRASAPPAAARARPPVGAQGEHERRIGPRRSRAPPSSQASTRARGARAHERTRSCRRPRLARDRRGAWRARAARITGRWR